MESFVDLRLVETLIAPEVVWHVPGEHDMAGTIDGREALLTWLGELGRIGFWLVAAAPNERRDGRKRVPSPPAHHCD